ncbi:MAG: hypothetical protein M3Q51_04475 [Pseudomonadota bacterium]|nr:hypothetical protein [Pseudomonadota bacterium]MDQ3160264.1 hypothetical protein [Pseudomonadota bacterium]
MNAPTNTGEINVTDDPKIDTTMIAETMLGELVSTCMDEIRHAPDIWQKLGEQTQDDVIKRVTSRCGDAIRQAVYLIAAEGRDVITADLEQITAKDGIKAVCVLSKNDPNRHQLLDAVGKPVLIVVASSQEFMGGEIPAPEPDQQGLPIADAMDAKR